MSNNNMIYDISGSFFYEDAEYPFNIMNEKEEHIDDFKSEIKSIVQRLLNDKSEHKVRFMWIAAEGYCQTEVFLKNILSKLEYPVLYLHWLDYVGNIDNEENPIGRIIFTKEVGNNYFLSLEGVKICVVDHAEEIKDPNYISELCNSYEQYDIDNFVFIFISKSKKGIQSEKEYWKKLTSKLGDQRYKSLVRSEPNFYIVKRYNAEICKQIFINEISNEEVKRKCCRNVGTIVYDMYRVLYFDLMLKFIRKYSSADEVPESFSDEKFINEVYRNASEGFVQEHIKSCRSLKTFIKKYMESDFVKNFPLGEQQRIPLDNYVWACGIVCYTRSETSYEENVKFLFENYKDSIDTKSFDSILEISKNVVNCMTEENNFSTEKYLYALSQNGLLGARFCAEVLNDIHYRLEAKTVEKIFKSICEKYKAKLDSEKDINTFRLLGMQIGRILPKLRNDVVENCLDCFFSAVKDDYVCPRSNENGISVIPVTNYEFEKFVKDSGYSNYYTKEIDSVLSVVSTKYYRDILEYILYALNGHNFKDSRFLATILKGYDWLQYKQIAYLYSKSDHILNSDIYKSIAEENYKHPLKHPAKWANEANEDTCKPFCNPLQPVVCVNLFEARAYTKWLSEKIKKDVRIVRYDPDYISIIGTNNDGVDDKQRVDFLKHLKNSENYINTVENSRFFYGEDFIDIREPSPIAIPNSVFSGIYDFLGNVFETQDTLYTYNYGVEVSAPAKKIFEEKEAELIDYNCPCGGLQRTKANLPPEYMGQVPAFLRNQDIGFRIVISGAEIKENRHQSNSHIAINYSDSEEEKFDLPINLSECSKLLESIWVGKYNNISLKVEDKLIKSEVFENDSRSVVFLSRKDPKESKEKIMLICDDNNIYAYYLNYISLMKTKNSESQVLFVKRKPNLPKELALRKKCKNLDCADWIDFVEWQRDNKKEMFLAFPINIANGYFTVPEHKINRDVINGEFQKKDASFIGTFKISFKEELSQFKTQYYNNLKLKLGTEFFLPDWIDIIDYISYISSTITDSEVLDVDVVMAAITTIDTSHLHEQINEKKLLEIEKNLQEEV